MDYEKFYLYSLITHSTAIEGSIVTEVENQLLSAKVMRRTGSEYSVLGGNFDSSKGELRRCNVSAGIGGRSYMAFTVSAKRR